MLSKINFENMEENSLISDLTIEKLKQFSVVVLWGTAGAAKYAKKYLASKNMKFDYVTDSFSHCKGELWNDIPFIDKNDVFAMGDSVIVLIACSYGYQIDRLLEEHSIQYVMFDTNLLYCHNFADFRDGIRVKKILLDSFEKIEEVYKLLEDQKSKDTFENVLAYRITLERNLVERVYEKNTYFGNDVIASFSGDTVVDCGAYIGDSMESFCNHGFSCRTYYALEPSAMQCNVLKECAKKFNGFNIKVMPLAAWNCRTTLSFTQNEGAGNHVGEAGDVIIQADAIDSITGDDCVDLIKMDIEGAEIPALNGAKKTIQLHHPIIASSIYHHLTDLWEIPLLLKDMYSGYKIYIRHHSPWGDDTVVYALP